MTKSAEILVVAHAGHWAIWVLYAVPIVVVVASIVISSRRSRDGTEDR